MDDQHALIDDAELFQPLDLGHSGARHARIVGRIAETRMRLQQWIAGFGVALKHRLGALKRHRSRLNHPFWQDAKNRFGQVER